MSDPPPYPTRSIRIPVETDVFVRAPQATACPLGPIETQVLARIDGTTPLSQIAALLNLSVRETAMIAARLVELGATEKRVDDVDAGWEDSRTDRATSRPPPGTDATG